MISLRNLSLFGKKSYFLFEMKSVTDYFHAKKIKKSLLKIKKKAKINQNPRGKLDKADLRKHKHKGVPGGVPREGDTLGNYETRRRSKFSIRTFEMFVGHDGHRTCLGPPPPCQTHFLKKLWLISHGLEQTTDKIRWKTKIKL